jgi:putative acetyltransferase
MIRLALPADLSDVFGIYMHPEVVPYLGYDAMSMEEFRNIYEGILDSRSFFVWEEGGRIKGFCRVVRHAGRSKHAAYLGTFAVHPDARGSGVAMRILDQLILDLNQKGISRVELTVLEDNSRAINFYKRYGFEIEGMIRSSFKRSYQEHYINELYMAMLFNPLVPAQPDEA